ncbi:MAG: hypothetical protein RIT45_3243 [Pseudomonadota bacterium]
MTRPRAQRFDCAFPVDRESGTLSGMRTRRPIVGLRKRAWLAATVLGSGCFEPYVLDAGAPPEPTSPGAVSLLTTLQDDEGAMGVVGVNQPTLGGPHANAAVCLRSAPAGVVLMPPTSTGACVERDVVLASCGDADARVASVAVQSKTPLQIEGVTLGTTVHPNGSATVRLRACPQVVGTYTGTVRIDLDGGQPLLLNVQGKADLGCLVPQLTLPASVAPDAPVEVDVLGSTSPTGGAVSASWTLVPPDPWAPVPKVADGPTARFTPHVAGRWKVCANVADEDGNAGCAAVCSELEVVPDTAIRVELLWRTPAGEPADSGAGPTAADLDLHLGREPGVGSDRDCDGAPDAWFVAASDVWAGHPVTAWGGSGVADDGALRVQDAGSDGLEVATVLAPDGDAATPAQFAIGVHGWNDHGLGESVAKVRIWIDGGLVAAAGPQTVAPLTMWTAARVKWPATADGDGNVLTCQQDGDPCDGGQRWTDAGGPCLTPCLTPGGGPAWGHAPLAACEGP